MLENLLWKIILKQLKKATNEDLLIALQKYFKHEKRKNINFTLSFNQFVHLFPRDSSLAGNNFEKTTRF